MTRTMIFHSPAPVRPGGATGSAIRPFQMLRAFHDLGYEVIEVTGDHHRRAEAIRDAERAITTGRVEFCYSELPTSPIAMSEPIRERVDPGLDFALFAACRQEGVPVGAFYRDVYWRFPGFLTPSRLPYRLLMRHHYGRELRRLEDCLDLMFLPSLRMGAYIPRISPDKFRELPPGAPSAGGARAEESRSPGVELFYVGSLGRFYDLRECAAAVAMTPGASMTLCVPEEQWKGLAGDYLPYLSERVRVVHGRGEELEPFFARASIGVLAMKPIEYRSFAAPVKLFEYIGRSLPVLASPGTLAGDLVVRERIGWAPEYSREAIAATLRLLVAEPSLVEGAASRAGAIRGEHTWEARARQAADMLLEVDPRGGGE